MGDVAESGDDVNHIPPSPTSIPQLDGDAPDDDNHDHDNDAADDNNPKRNLDDDAPDNNDEDTVFNSVNCQHTIEECNNEMCFSFNYDDILESDI